MEKDKPKNWNRLNKGLKISLILSAAAPVALLSACGYFGGDDASPAAIQAAIDAGDYGRAAALATAAFEAGESNADIRYLDALTDLATNDGIGAETN